jgi:hypothetical protein
MADWPGLRPLLPRMSARTLNTIAALPIAPRYRRWPAVLGSAGAVVLVLVATLEVLGWPFLAQPMQRWLSASLHRNVSFAIDGNTPASVAVRLLGRVRIEAPLVQIGPPAWSQSAHMIRASDAVISFHYGDLWRAWRSEPLRIHMLEADEFDAEVERLADGRASWQFEPATARDPRSAAVTPSGGSEFPLFDELKLNGGSLRWRDAVTGLRMDVECRSAQPSDVAASAPSASSPSPASGLACNARGTWHADPVAIVLQSSAPMPWVDREADSDRVPITVDATVGDTHVSLQGHAVDALSLNGLGARFESEGSSLSTLAQLIGIRVSPRAPFRASGQVSNTGRVWHLGLDRLHVGTSDLSARLNLDHGREPALLTGRVEGAWLSWRDMAELPARSPAAGKVLVDLPAFRTLDADLAIDIAQADLGESLPHQALRGRWKIHSGRAEWTPANGTKF